MRENLDQPRASLSYIVRRHEHLDAEFAEVTLRCLGYPSKNTQPVEWAFALKVPKDEPVKWPLGANVRVVIT